MKGKVTIIGGAGFLGSHIADVLHESGYQTTIFDRKESNWNNGNHLSVLGSILDKEDVHRALNGADYVYHLAGIADINESVENPRDTVETNIIGSVNVIEECLKQKIKRLVFASTVYVYSQKGSFYRVSKQAVEHLLEAYRESHGLEYTVLRYGSLYGPRAQAWNGLKRYISEMVKGHRIIYQGDGNERREYIHVLDAARLSMSALAEKYRNKCLILTGTQVLTSRQLLQMIKEILGKDIQVQYQTDGSDVHHYGLTPYRFSPKEGIKVVPNEFYDLGQGILDLIEEVYQESGNGRL